MAGLIASYPNGGNLCNEESDDLLKTKSVTLSLTDRCLSKISNRWLFFIYQEHLPFLYIKKTLDILRQYKERNVRYFRLILITQWDLAPVIR